MSICVVEMGCGGMATRDLDSKMARTSDGAFGCFRRVWSTMTSHMDLLDLSKVTTMVALGHWSTLLANLEEWSFGMLA